MEGEGLGRLQAAQIKDGKAITWMLLGECFPDLFSWLIQKESHFLGCVKCVTYDCRKKISGHIVIGKCLNCKIILADLFNFLVPHFHLPEVK